MSALIDIVRIGNLTLGKNDKFDTLESYYTIATKLVSKYAPRIRNGLAQEMLNNEDAMSNIVYNIILADSKFNGNGNKYGYRKDMAIYAIKKYFNRSSQNKKKYTYSIDQKFNDDTTSLSSSLEDNKLSPAQKLEISEYIDYVLDKVSAKQADYLKKYYLDGMSLTEIAKEKGISRQAVHNVIQLALKKIRNHISKC